MYRDRKEAPETHLPNSPEATLLSQSVCERSQRFSSTSLLERGKRNGSVRRRRRHPTPAVTWRGGARPPPPATLNPCLAQPVPASPLSTSQRAAAERKCRPLAERQPKGGRRGGTRSHCPRRPPNRPSSHFPETKSARPTASPTARRSPPPSFPPAPYRAATVATAAYKRLCPAAVTGREVVGAEHDERPRPPNTTASFFL